MLVLDCVLDRSVLGWRLTAQRCRSRLERRRRLGTGEQRDGQGRVGGGGLLDRLAPAAWIALAAELLRSSLVLAGANQPEADPSDDGYLTAPATAAARPCGPPRRSSAMASPANRSGKTPTTGPPGSWWATGGRCRGCEWLNSLSGAGLNTRPQLQPEMP